jgi:poly-beta-1,6-N-acetyl-D-glucosamine synthase
MFINIAAYTILSILCCYVVLLAIVTVGWYTRRTWKTKKFEPHTKVTVIIPARNESANIMECLTNISNQHYPLELLDIIVVDDCSTDNTVVLIKDFISRNPEKRISLIELTASQSSLKKQAIAVAVKSATGDLIVTTDADCIMSAKWVSSIVTLYESSNAVMIAGPVCFRKSDNIFSKMQELEFLSLIASGAATMNIGMPTMSNGANLAYEKNAFQEVGGFETNKKYASGDDVFLMHKMKKELSRKIRFIKSTDAIVETKPTTSFISFFNQRKRWASKSRGYKDVPTIIIALIIFLTNFSILSCFVLSFFSATFLLLFLISFFMKFIADFPVLFGICSFLKKEKLMYLYIPVQLLYPIYIVLTAIAGLSGKYKWKDRIHS